MKKLIITDLDGTLLQNSVEIYKKDLEKMREFQEKYLIGVATGRSLKEIKYIEKNNNLKFSYKIAFNGAQIQKDDELIFEKHIDEDILSLIHISEPTRRRGISYAVFCLKKKKNK